MCITFFCPRFSLEGRWMAMAHTVSSLNTVLYYFIMAKWLEYKSAPKGYGWLPSTFCSTKRTHELHLENCFPPSAPGIMCVCVYVWMQVVKKLVTLRHYSSSPHNFPDFVFTARTSRREKGVR